MAMSKRILVIEDEIDYRLLLVQSLREAGFEVRFAVRGAEGLEMAEKEPPDMILLDLNLPDTTGYEVCRKLRQSNKNGRVPIIMVTIQSDIPDIVRGMKHGADDYISKPFDPDEVIARVSALFRRSNS